MKLGTLFSPRIRSEVSDGEQATARTSIQSRHVVIAFMCWTILLVAGGAVILERYWIYPLRAQLKGVQIAAYGNAQRINGLENLQATSPLMLRSGRDAAALTPVEQCVETQVTGVKERYDAIRDAYLACSAPLASFFDRFRLSFSEAERFAVFVTLLSSRLGSYGPSDSTDPAQIAKDDVLNCTQTMIFVARTIKRYYPEAKVSEIGISNQAMGEHGFVEMSNGGRTLLLDGLVGLVADISLDEATAGRRPRPFLMLEFFPETNANLRALAENLMRTLRLGGLSRADINFEQQVVEASLRG
jgi:hypothetical protein